MLFSWLKRRRRQKLLTEPFPDAWRTYLHENVAHYCQLRESEQAALRDRLRIFVAEKSWEGCGGLEITDEIKVTIAAGACLLVLGMEGHYFDQVLTILVYPRAVMIPREQHLGGGLTLEGQLAVEGIAYQRGPVSLSWEDTLAEARDPSAGCNLVYHEFAHQLDMEDGEVNGTPLLTDRALDRRWQQVMTAEYDRLRADLEEGRPALLDHGGGDDPGEFFAVATETFFTRPRALRRRHRALYNLFRDYYRQDPAEWPATDE